MAVAAPRVTAAAGRVSLTVSAEEAPERLRLHNLSPLKGSRKQKQRLGRGYGGKGVSTTPHAGIPLPHTPSSRKSNWLFQGCWRPNERRRSASRAVPGSSNTTGCAHHAAPTLASNSRPSHDIPIAPHSSLSFFHSDNKQCPIHLYEATAADLLRSPLSTGWHVRVRYARAERAVGPRRAAGVRGRADAPVPALPQAQGHRGW